MPNFDVRRVYKGLRQGWQEDLTFLEKNNDQVLLQEACLTVELQRFCTSLNSTAGMSLTSQYSGNHTGALTAARVFSLKSCVRRVGEPWLRLPKSSLVSYHPFAGLVIRLMVVNIHPLNVAPGLDDFNRKMESIAGFISLHPGSLVLAGNFNTWSNSRQASLERFSRQLGLHKVNFDAQEPVRSSAHYPLQVSFALPQHSQL